MSGSWVNTVVYGTAAAPVAYTALDLSAHTGSAEKLVYLKFKSTLANHRVAVKPGAGSAAPPDPHPENWHTWQDHNAGTSEGRVIIAGECLVLACMTDDLGVVRWIADAATEWTVTLLVIQDVTPVWGSAYHSGAAPGAWVWANKDLSGLIGAVDRLVWSKCKPTAVGAPSFYTHRYDNDPDHQFPGVGCFSFNLSGTSFGIFSQTIAGIIEHSGNATLNVFLGCASADWTNSIAHASNPIHNGATPVVEADLDLSPVVGAQRVVALLKIEGTTNPYNNLYLKPKGDTDNYLWATGNTGTGLANPYGVMAAWPYAFAAGFASYAVVITDAAGVARWKAPDAGASTVTVLGYDVLNLAPTAAWIAPAGPGILPGATISGTTADPDDGIDPTKTRVTLTPPAGPAVDAILGGVVQAGYTGTCTAAGFSITKDGGMAPGSWTGVLHCEDFAGASDDANGAWTVAWTTPPSVVYQHPQGFTPEIDQMRFSITDTYGLDPATLSLAVVVTGDGRKVEHAAITAGAAEPGWEIAVMPGNYDGAIPRRLDVVVTGWPRAIADAIAAVYRRLRMVIGVTSSTGVEL